tara:strand:+ start:419 stop:943 length:525 start_codon:yes stop_codon:yes gene_type:complete
MFQILKNNQVQENLLYNKILSLSRNKLLYTKFFLDDTFQNRINLIFIHMSFLFIKIKQDTNGYVYKDFYQKMFDLIFKNIEINMREIGYGDVTVNKKMKLLVRLFYNILLKCELYKSKNHLFKHSFLKQHLAVKRGLKDNNNHDLIRYFDKYQSFCIDLAPDSVLKGELNFKYN